MSEKRPTFEVVDDGDGILRATVSASVVRRPVAEALCAELGRASAGHDRRSRLLLDLGALQRATPAAGFYAFRTMKKLDLAAIALYRGNRFMRGFARTVMRVARFPAFAFFDDEGTARAWLLERAPAADAPR